MNNVVTVFDVAAYILNKLGPEPVPAMKLQKLVYYAQAWSLVWDEKPLFRDKIEAWANGPVVRTLYEHHRGKFEVRRADIENSDARKLSSDQRETVDKVLGFYGNKSSFWLSQLTHRELPWKEARGSLPDGERGNNEITRAAMAEYYGSLVR